MNNSFYQNLTCLFSKFFFNIYNIRKSTILIWKYDEINDCIFLDKKNSIFNSFNEYKYVNISSKYTYKKNIDIIGNVFNKKQNYLICIELISKDIFNRIDIAKLCKIKYIDFQINDNIIYEILIY